MKNSCCNINRQVDLKAFYSSMKLCGRFLEVRLVAVPYGSGRGTNRAAHVRLSAEKGFDRFRHCLPFFWLEWSFRHLSPWPPPRFCRRLPYICPYTGYREKEAGPGDLTRAGPVPAVDELMPCSVDRGVALWVGAEQHWRPLGYRRKEGSARMGLGGRYQAIVPQAH